MVITEEDLADMQLLDDFLTSHQRNFEHKKSLWRSFIDRAKEECRDKLESLRDNKPTKRQEKLIEQFVFSNMLNTTLEKNHEEMFEFHFKHELMESNFVRKKLSVNAQGLLSMLKLIMTCEDPNLKLTMSSSPSGIHHDRVISH